MGIDGYTFFSRDPIQVKRSEHIGRPVLDSFQTAMRREGKQCGCIVAFSFTRGAHEEAARGRAEHNIAIELLTLRDILRARGELRTPAINEMLERRAPTSFLDLPLPESRRRSQRRPASRLIANVRRSTPLETN
jgi:hypothetical protein